MTDTKRGKPAMTPEEFRRRLSAVGWYALDDADRLDPADMEDLLAGLERMAKECELKCEKSD